MRFPRLIDFAHTALAALGSQHSPAAHDSISSKLWTACQDLANEALNSDFMQGIGNGTLSPDSYGQYTIHDCAYCVAAADDYRTMESRANAASESSLAAFAQARYEGFIKYNKQYLPAWHIGNTDALVLNSAAKQYIAHEHTVANTLDPIYGVITQIPCSQLWPWLADQLKPASPDHNLYGFWLTENDGWSGAHRLDNFVNAWFAANPDQYDWKTALFAMQGSMTGEVNMFRSACGQSLLPMPVPPTA